MEMVVYIHGMNNFPDSDDGLYAYMGFKLRGSKIKIFTDIREVPLKRNVIVVGGLHDTEWFFKEMGWKNYIIPTIPEELYKFTGREIKIVPLSEALSYENYPYFIKPYSRVKEFDSGVIEHAGMKKLIPDGISRDTLALVSSTVNFISEYRCYVIDRKVVGIKHYKGDIWTFPNQFVIGEAIHKYKSQPASYSIDFGITDKGETLLVETNDGWSLGNYGLEIRQYTSLLVARWMEILKSNPVM